MCSICYTVCPNDILFHCFESIKDQIFSNFFYLLANYSCYIPIFFGYNNLTIIVKKMDFLSRNILLIHMLDHSHNEFYFNSYDLLGHFFWRISSRMSLQIVFGACKFFNVEFGFISQMNWIESSTESSLMEKSDP